MRTPSEMSMVPSSLGTLAVVFSGLVPVWNVAWVVSSHSSEGRQDDSALQLTVTELNWLEVRSKGRGY